MVGSDLRGRQGRPQSAPTSRLPQARGPQRVLPQELFDQRPGVGTDSSVHVQRPQVGDDIARDVHGVLLESPWGHSSAAASLWRARWTRTFTAGTDTLRIELISSYGMCAAIASTSRSDSDNCRI